MLRWPNENTRVAKLLLPETAETKETHSQALRSNAKISQHVIIVLDASKSMSKKDSYQDAPSPLFNVGEKFSRMEQARVNIAKYIGGELTKRAANAAKYGECVNDNVVYTLVLMQGSDAVVSFKCLPLTVETYNLVVKRCKVTKGGEGCYIPALQLVQKLVQDEENSDIRNVAMFFMSDGRPSDRGGDVKKSIVEEATKLGSATGKMLTAQFSGFGEEDFAVLREIDQELKCYDCLSLFASSTRGSSSVSSTITQFSKMAESSRLENNDDKEKERGHKNRAIPRERKADNFVRDVWEETEGWQCYSSSVHDIARYDYDVVNEEFTRQDEPFSVPGANGFRVRDRVFGEGSERYAFLFHEAKVQVRKSRRGGGKKEMR